MGVAHFVVAEREVAGFDPVEAVPDGKSVARASDHLDALAATAGVHPLGYFTSMSPEEAASFGGWLAPEDREPDRPYPEFGGEEPPGPDQYPPESWFEPAEGLATVRALIAAVTADMASLEAAIYRPRSGIGAAEVIADLHDFEAALARLDAASVRWHLAIDI